MRIKEVDTSKRFRTGVSYNVLSKLDPLEVKGGTIKTQKQVLYCFRQIGAVVTPPPRATAHI